VSFLIKRAKGKRPGKKVKNQAGKHDVEGRGDGLPMDRTRQRTLIYHWKGGKKHTFQRGGKAQRWRKAPSERLQSPFALKVRDPGKSSIKGGKRGGKGEEVRGCRD